MKKRFYLFVLFLFIVSCKNKNTVVFESIKDEIIISDTIYTRMPGDLLVLDDFVVWIDPFANKNFLHILDKEDGHEVERFGNIGQGPNDFLSPRVSSVDDNRIFIYDSNAKKNAFVDFQKNAERLTFLPLPQDELVTQKIFAEPLGFVSLKPNDYEFIEILKEDYSYSLDSWVKDKELKNRFEVFQGNIGYNIKKKILVYAPRFFPFFRLYKQNSEGQLEFEKECGEQAKFDIANNELLFNKDSFSGCFDMTLSKDYIILLHYQPQKTNEEMKELGRDFSKLPQKFLLYDYNGKLKRIVDAKMPVLRIASNSNDNDLYFIALSPEYTLYKCSL